jgi:hypothetical protein
MSSLEAGGGAEAVRDLVRLKLKLAAELQVAGVPPFAFWKHEAWQ